MVEENDFSQGAAFIEGEYVPVNQARIPVLDWGFTRSDVTYDVVHVWQGYFFRLEDHLQRFLRSCEKIKLDPGYDKEQIHEILANCVTKAALKDAYVEMVCSRGVPVPGSRDPRDCENRFFAFAIPFVWVLSPELQDRGARLYISDIPRISPKSVDPTVKNFHWADLTRGLFQAYEHGADTVVLVDMEGNISEGPGFNVFCVRDGTILSPGGTVLEGVTRTTVKELCDEMGIEFSLGAMSPEALRGADEVFLSSTAGGIMPVKYVDDVELASIEPGSLSLTLRDLYWRKHEQGWHATAV